MAIKIPFCLEVVEKRGKRGRKKSKEAKEKKKKKTKQPKQPFILSLILSTKQQLFSGSSVFFAVFFLTAYFFFSPFFATCN